MFTPGCRRHCWQCLWAATDSLSVLTIPPPLPTVFCSNCGSSVLPAAGLPLPPPSSHCRWCSHAPPTVRACAVHDLKHERCVPPGAGGMSTALRQRWQGRGGGKWGASTGGSGSGGGGLSGELPQADTVVSAVRGVGWQAQTGDL